MNAYMWAFAAVLCISNHSSTHNARGKTALFWEQSLFQISQSFICGVSLMFRLIKENLANILQIDRDISFVQTVLKTGKFLMKSNTLYAFSGLT